MPRTQSANRPSATLPTPRPISLAAFQDIIDQFGEDPARWPDDRRAEAEALLDVDPAARALVAEAAQIRAWLQRRAVRAPDRMLQAIDARLGAVEQPDMQSGAVAIGHA